MAGRKAHPVLLMDSAPRVPGYVSRQSRRDGGVDLGERHVMTINGSREVLGMDSVRDKAIRGLLRVLSATLICQRIPAFWMQNLG